MNSWYLSVWQHTSVLRTFLSITHLFNNDDSQITEKKMVTTDALPCHIYLAVCLWNMDPHNRAPKKNTSHGNEVLPQDTTYLIQRPCYQRGSLCYRMILCISCKDHVTNEEVRAKIQQAIGLHEDLLTIVKRRKLHWYGDVSRSSGLAKTILQGTVKGGRRQGRQRKMWEDNIREWTGLEFAKSKKAVENRGKWRKLVAKKSVVPQRSLRLRDRWDERWDIQFLRTLMYFNFNAFFKNKNIVLIFTRKKITKQRNERTDEQKHLQMYSRLAVKLVNNS